MRRRAADPATETPRPPCSSCGEPATCVVTVSVQDLALEREAGVRSVAYWTPSFRADRVRVSNRLCEKCFQSSVKVETSVVARARGAPSDPKASRS